MSISNRTTHLITLAAGTKKNENLTGQTILVLVAFFFVILALFSIGLGCSYLYYRHSTKKRKTREEENHRILSERRQQQIRYKALAAAQFFRGVPNSYSPTPKDENTKLLDMDMSVVPVQVRAE